MRHLDPRLKLPLLLIISLTTATMHNNELLLVGLAFPVLGLLFYAPMPLFAACKRLALINIFVAMLCLSALLFTPGRVLVAVGGVRITAEGAAYALRLALRANIAGITILVLWASSSLAELGGALQYYRMPNTLVQLLLLADRYAHVLLEQWTRIRNALKVRGFRPRTNLHTYRTLGYVVGMLLVGSHERAQAIDWAMRCRGFSGKFPVKHSSFRYGEILFFMIFVSVYVSIWIMDSHF